MLILCCSFLLRVWPELTDLPVPKETWYEPELLSDQLKCVWTDPRGQESFGSMMDLSRLYIQLVFKMPPACTDVRSKVILMPGRRVLHSPKSPQHLQNKSYKRISWREKYSQLFCILLFCFIHNLKKKITENCKKAVWGCHRLGWNWLNKLKAIKTKVKTSKIKAKG